MGTICIIDNVSGTITPGRVPLGYFNPLKTRPEYTRGWGLWEMRVVAKSVRLQRVKSRGNGVLGLGVGVE